MPEVTLFNIQSGDCAAYDVTVFIAVLLFIREVQSLNISAKYTDNFSEFSPDFSNKWQDSIVIYTTTVVLYKHSGSLGMCSSTVLRSVDWWLVTDVSGQPIGLIFY
jgi:hypothetical protein